MTAWQLFTFYSVSGFSLAILFHLTVLPVTLGFRFLIDTLNDFLR